MSLLPCIFGISLALVRAALRLVGAPLVLVGSAALLLVLAAFLGLLLVGVTTLVGLMLAALLLPVVVAHLELLLDIEHKVNGRGLH